MTRTDDNAHNYYFTESLPHANLTRVGMLMGVQEAPLDREQQTPAQPNADPSRQCNFCE
jgi:hypothetical protein